MGAVWKLTLIALVAMAVAQTVLLILVVKPFHHHNSPGQTSYFNSTSPYFSSP